MTDANLAATVHTSQGDYRVVTGRGALRSIGAEMAAAGLSGRGFIIADSALFPAGARAVQEALESGGFESHVLAIDLGDLSFRVMDGFPYPVGRLVFGAASLFAAGFGAKHIGQTPPEIGYETGGPASGRIRLASNIAYGKILGIRQLAQGLAAVFFNPVLGILNFLRERPAGVVKTGLG